MVSFSLLNAIDPTTIVFIVLLALLIVALLVVPMFTNKKRAKQTDELHRSLQPGDLVKTIGGVVGTIVEIRQISPVDKEMVIETGVGDRKTTMVFDIQALYQVMSRSSTIVPAKDESESAEEAETAPEQNNEPVKEVPPIMADRTPEPEVKDEPVSEEHTAEESVVEAKEEVAEQPVAEQAAVEEKAVESDTKDAVVEPEKAEPKTAAAQKKPAQKSASAKKSTGTKKSTSNGGAKKK